MSPHLMMPIGLDTFQQGPHLFIIQLSIHLDLDSIKGTNPPPFQKSAIESFVLKMMTH